MKPTISILFLLISLTLTSCLGSRNPKRGCPANGSNLGAERVLAGEGGKKPAKFKVKDMQKSFTQ